MKRRQLIMFFAVFMLMCIVGTKVEANAETTAVKFGQVYNVEAGENGDASILYDLNVPTSGKVTVTHSFIEGQYSWTDVILKIVDKAGNVWCEVKVDGENKNVIQSFDLVSGDYEVRYQSGGGALHNSFKTSFKIEFTSAKETIKDSLMDKHDSIVSAAKYPKMDSKVTGHFALNDNMDVYKIKVTKSGIYNITLTNKYIKEMHLTLTDSFGEFKFEQYDLGVGTHKFNIPVTKGTYYLTVIDEDVRYYTGTYSIKTKLNNVPKVKLSSIKNSAKKAAKVSWKRSSSVEGYQVQLSTSSKFKKSVKNSLIEDKAVSNKVFNKLSKGKKYYARVRTYVTAANGKKVYSAWSNVKNIKIKK